MRILAVDFGKARIGLALSDPLGCIASPLEAIRGSSDPKNGARLLQKHIANIEDTRKIKIELVLVGYPKKLDGSSSEMTQQVQLFYETLKTLLACPVELFDERLTSVQAERDLKMLQLNRKQRTAIIDGASASILLQSYLDFKKRQEVP